MPQPACPTGLIADDAGVRPSLFVLALIALASRLSAQAQAPDDGLKVMLFPTIQYAHEDIWTKTPNGRGPVFALASQMVRRQALHLVVVGVHYATDAERRAEVRYRISSVRPDGSPGAATGNLKFISGPVTADTRMLHMAAEQSAWQFDSDDPLGVWRLVLEATDTISGITVKDERTITLRGDELLEEALPADFDQRRWLMAYHFQPAPHQLLAALKRVAEHPPAGAKPRRDVENGTWLGFFEQVLADNPWLLPHVVARLEQSTGREQELLATSLAYARRDDRAFFETLSGKSREVFMRHRIQNWPVPHAEPTTGTQLDVHWGRFFASGRFAPIRELVAVLAYHPNRTALDDFKKLETKPARVPVEVKKSAVFGAVVWSLDSNIQRDKVVRDYCEGILLRKELPEAEHGWLTQIYRSATEKLPPTATPAPAGKDR